MDHNNNFSYILTLSYKAQITDGVRGMVMTELKTTKLLIAMEYTMRNTLYFCNLCFLI